MMIIIWHLLVNNETYKDTQYKALKHTKKVYVKVPRKTSIKEVLKLVREASVILQELDPENG